VGHIHGGPAGLNHPRPPADPATGVGEEKKKPRGRSQSAVAVPEETSAYKIDIQGFIPRKFQRQTARTLTWLSGLVKNFLQECSENTRRDSRSAASAFPGTVGAERDPRVVGRPPSVEHAPLRVLLRTVLARDGSKASGDPAVAAFLPPHQSLVPL
jgi:hypothetical protein